MQTSWSTDRYQVVWEAGSVRRYSKTCLSEDASGDWRQHLLLYEPEDILWIGGAVTESGHERHKANFRPAADWLALRNAPGRFICPATFRADVSSRSRKSVLRRPFLVVESDTLSKAEIVGVFRWMQHYTRLRAIVDTGGKSLHGWFDMPDQDLLSAFEIYLPQLGCDPALFRPSQPCRLPGAMRDPMTRQRLLYLDLRRGAGGKQP